MLLDPSETLHDLHGSLERSFYSSRALLHSRRLLSLFLLSASTINQDFFGFSSVRIKEEANAAEQAEFFHANPIDYAKARFDHDQQVFVGNQLKASPDAIIESYSKSIRKNTKLNSIFYIYFYFIFYF